MEEDISGLLDEGKMIFYLIGELCYDWFGLPFRQWLLTKLPDVVAAFDDFHRLGALVAYQLAEHILSSVYQAGTGVIDE